MTEEELILEVENLSHFERTQRVSALARELFQSNPAGLNALLAELMSGDQYALGLAVTVAQSTRDVGALTALASSNNGAIRTAAVASLPPLAVLTEDDAVGIYRAASARERSALIRSVLKSHRSDLASAIVREAIAANRRREAAHALSAAGSTTVAEWIDELSPILGSARSLARSHSEQFLDAADRDLAGLPVRARTEWWARRSYAMSDVVLGSPGATARVLDLMVRFAPGAGWSAGNSPLISAVILRAPSQAAKVIAPRLYVGERRLGLPQLSKRAVRSVFSLPTEEAVAFAEAYLARSQNQYQRMIVMAPRRERATVLEALLPRRANAAATAELRAALPESVRVANARKLIASFDAVGRWSVPERVELPFVEAEPVLRELLSDPLPANRAQGYSLLVRGAALSRDPEVFAAVLASFTRLPNEQEPVRTEMFRALASVPLRALRATSPELLSELIRDAYSARDHSAATGQFIRNFAQRILGSDGEDDPVGRLKSFAMDALLSGNGQVSFPGLERIGAANASDLVERALPVLNEHAARDRFDVAFALARALGRLAWDIDALTGILQRAAESSTRATASRAIASLLANPRTRVARARAFVASDRSAIAVPELGQVVARVATDLLTPGVLEGVVHGRFLSEKTVWIPETRWADHWTRSQRTRLVERLQALSGQPAEELSLRHDALRALADLGGEGVATLRAWYDAPNVLDAELALTLLGGLSSDNAGDDKIVAALSTDRARVAGPSLVRRAGVLRERSAVSLIATATALDIKLTSRKSLVYSVARARPANAWPLMDMALGAHPHRDVSDAVASAALTMLDDESALEHVRAFLASSPRAAGLLFHARAVAYPIRQRELLGELLALVCRSSSADTRNRALNTASRWASYSPKIREVVWEALRDFSTPTDAVGESWVVVSLLEDGVADGFAGVVADLLNQVDSQVSRVGVADEPLARRRMDAVLKLDRLGPLGRLPEASVAELSDVVSALAERDDFSLTSARIAWMLALQPTAPDSAFVQLRQAMRGRVSVAVDLLERIVRGTSVTPERRIAYLRAFDSVRSGSTAERIVALGVVAKFGALEDWPPDWSERLEAFRADGDPEVRELALRVDTTSHRGGRLALFVD